MRIGECSSSLSTDSSCVLETTPTAAIVPEDVVTTVPAAANVTANVTDDVTVNATASATSQNVTVNATGSTNGSTSSNATSSAPAVKLVYGMLDACTVEGVATGMRVAGTYRFGVGG